MTLRATMSGAREVAAHLETLPPAFRKRLKPRITVIAEALQANVVESIPARKSRRWSSSLPPLAQFITERTFDDRPGRIAAYVSVYAPGQGGEYPKAATLEYGRKTARNDAITGHRLARKAALKAERLRDRASVAVNLQAYEYLRGPLSRMRDDFLVAVDETVVEMTAENA